MKRIRIGKDIKIVWKILTNLKPLSLEEKDIRLVLTTPLGRKSDLPFHVSNDIVYSSYPGILQKETGVYKLTLWVNYGKPGQSVVDNSMAFKIVSSTCQEPEQDINPEETVTACGNLIVGVTGDSAYEIAVRNGFVGSEKEWLESLKGGTTSIIPSFKLKDNMELEATYPNSDNTDVERVVIGKVAVTPKGEYEEDEIYNILDIVGKDGCSYISKKSANTDPPENDESWLCIAKKGDSIKYEDLTPEQLEELQKPATKSAEALSDLGKRLKVLVWELEELEQISNLRDYVYSVNEDDIEIEDGYFTKKKIKFADRKYNPSAYSGKGYKILRKNIVGYTVKLEFEIESGCTNNGTITVSVNGISYDIEITSDSITPESVAQLISSSIPGSTIEGNVITFNGETSISFSTTGIKGKVTNRYISEKNVLTQDMINEPNTVYEIRYDFDLNEQIIYVPENCTIDFKGGNISNGCLISNKTVVYNLPKGTDLRGKIYNSRKEEITLKGDIIKRNTKMLCDYFARAEGHYSVDKYGLSIYANNVMKVGITDFIGIIRLANDNENYNVSIDTSYEQNSAYTSDQAYIDNLYKNGIRELYALKFHTESRFDSTQPASVIMNKYVDFVTERVSNLKELGLKFSYVYIMNEETKWTENTEENEYVKYLVRLAENIKSLGFVPKISFTTFYELKNANKKLYDVIEPDFNFYPTVSFLDENAYYDENIAKEIVENIIQPLQSFWNEKYVTSIGISETGCTSREKSLRNPSEYREALLGETRFGVLNLYWKVISDIINIVKPDHVCMWYDDWISEKYVDMDDLYNTIVKEIY